MGIDHLPGIKREARTEYQGGRTGWTGTRANKCEVWS
jgi:hypothetical protein